MTKSQRYAAVGPRVLPVGRAALLASCLSALFLTGCTAAQQAAFNQGVEHARAAKDTEAEALKAAVCAMSIGAYHRVNSDAEQRALDVLCGGADQPTVTAGQVRVMRDLMEALGGS